MRFVDTNILLYSITSQEAQAAKSAKAQSLLKSRDLVLSTQVLQEFYVQATHARRPDALSHEIAVKLIDTWYRFRVQETTLAVFKSALLIKERYHISFWDAAIVAAAKASGCKQLLTEDLSHGQDYAGVQVCNPFVGP